MPMIPDGPKKPKTYADAIAFADKIAFPQKKLAIGGCAIPYTSDKGSPQFRAAVKEVIEESLHRFSDSETGTKYVGVYESRLAPYLRDKRWRNISERWGRLNDIVKSLGFEIGEGPRFLDHSCDGWRKPKKLGPYQRVYLFPKEWEERK